MELRDRDYERLLEFRTALRQFLHWSETQAVGAGITAAQHQLLLAVRGHLGDRGPTVGDLADSLLLRHHSAVELIDRAEEAGLVRRVHDPDDRRVVRLRLTARGTRVLERLAEVHVEELARLTPRIRGLFDGLTGWDAGATRRRPSRRAS